jgi:hypothetical protein
MAELTKLTIAWRCSIEEVTEEPVRPENTASEPTWQTSDSGAADGHIDTDKSGIAPQFQDQMGRKMNGSIGVYQGLGD